MVIEANTHKQKNEKRKKNIVTKVNIRIVNCWRLNFNKITLHVICLCVVGSSELM